MPLYEYQCDACGSRFEVIQRFSDPPVSECQSCGGSVRKLFSSPAIHFKGSGWYVTDYARKGQIDPSSAETSAPASGKNGTGAAAADTSTKTPSSDGAAKVTTPGSSTTH
jgi:putative FmdB family regulatory protein